MNIVVGSLVGCQIEYTCPHCGGNDYAITSKSFYAVCPGYANIKGEYVHYAYKTKREANDHASPRPPYKVILSPLDLVAKRYR